MPRLGTWNPNMRHVEIKVKCLKYGHVYCMECQELGCPEKKCAGTKERKHFLPVNQSDWKLHKHWNQ
jgi:hypothetical protein